MENNRVAVIILNYKTWKDTIIEAEHCHDILCIEFSDIIIVDNNSPNDSADQLQKYCDEKGLIFLKSNINKGYAAGNNIGLRYASTKKYAFALILNNDVIIDDKSFMKKILSTFDKESSLAVVNPDICSIDGKIYNRDAIRPNIFDFTLGMFFYPIKGRVVHDLGGYGFVYRPQGCCMMLDLNKIEEVNFLDEATFLYSEEYILAEKLIEKNYKCACRLDTKAVHNHSNTVKNTITKKRQNKIALDSFIYYLSVYRQYSKAAIKICCIFKKIKYALSK